MTGARKILHLPSLYPVTACYISGVLALVLMSVNAVTLGQAILGFGIACVLVLLSVSHRELSTVHNDVGVVHELVNSQRTAMAERIDALIAALMTAGVDVPVDPDQVQVVKVDKAMVGAHEDIAEKRGDL